MKSTPSSSCSSPSSCGGRGGRRIACLSRILRRILCFSSLPLCSFDHFREDERESPVAIVGAPGAPLGVVARLMGLESSVPRVEPVEESPSADQFKTSRSPQVRRPYDIPPYQELHDDKFFILSFEKRRHRKSKKSKEKKYDESENSSPNSVLEFVGYSADQESVSSGEMANSKMRRPLLEELESCGDSDSNREGENRNLVITRQEKSNYAVSGKLAAEESVRSSWITNNNNCFLEIGRDVASCIFDHLLEELELELELELPTN